MTIGFIGLGIMGSRMAANLLRTGHPLTVYNRTKEKGEALVAAGARWAETPAAAAREADVLVTMLASPETVAEAAEGPDGFLEALRPGAIWMDCSTVNPSFSRLAAEQATAHGVRFVDAPAVGSAGPAEKGELLFLAGGDAGTLEWCRPLLEAMGRRTIHAGGTGAGTGLKMLFNLLLAQAMAAFSEALVLGEAMGLDRARLFDILLAAPVAPPFLAGKRDKIEGDDYSPQFPLKWMRKDLHLAGQTAYEHDVALPMTSAAEELYALAARAGFGEDDFAAVYRFLRAEAAGSRPPA